jgi:predicted O-methyltransferase YrrM
MNPEPSRLINDCFKGILGRDAQPHELAQYQPLVAEPEWLARLCQALVDCDEFKHRGAEGREFVPPGHFYSVIPSFQAREQYLKTYPDLVRQRALPGIEVDEPAWTAHLQRMASLATDIPFPREKSEDFRYFFKNPAYSYGDALSLFRMLSDVRPARLVEIGSGYSSALTLDALDIIPGLTTELTFIEPYPELLYSLLSESDPKRTTVIATGVQAVPLEVFTKLGAGDILFIDSTHVSKLLSDVNYLYFEVLPRLAPGVIIHVHDIFWPFDYPPDWVGAGRAWNEAYILRAMLSGSKRYRIRYFSDYMRIFHGDWIRAHAPLIAENYGGHVWLEVV